jgi:hypothetical protein
LITDQQIQKILEHEGRSLAYARWMQFDVNVQRSLVVHAFRALRNDGANAIIAFAFLSGLILSQELEEQNPSISNDELTQTVNKKVAELFTQKLTTKKGG